MLLLSHLIELGQFYEGYVVKLTASIGIGIEVLVFSFRRKALGLPWWDLGQTYWTILKRVDLHGYMTKKPYKGKPASIKKDCTI